ncbi:MAG: apolipoprotein N-acyltransferase [Gammaproteobacteria bacterium]|nr:MAG: apolipoprotein N-acyltransferase [Gammaproteobacteria bacterium]
MTNPPAWLRSWLALAAGALLPLAFAPFGFWPLTILCPALLLWCWQEGSYKQLAWRGWLFGVGMFGTGTSWVYVSIHTYGEAPVPLAALLTLLFSAGLALFTSLQAWLFAHLRRHPYHDALVLFPALWIVSEWLRGWFLTGFPWLYLGTPHVDTWLGAWAPFLGVLSISGLCCLCAGALVMALQQRQYLSRVAVIIAVVITSSLLLSAIRWTQPQPAITVALVQGNVPQQLKWDPEYRDTTLALYASMTQPLWGTQLVVWPEAALPVFMDDISDWLGTQEQLALQHGSTLVTGIPSRQQTAGGWHYYNSMIALGYGIGSYHKHKLVPFGEYVPLEGWLRGLIRFFDLPMSAFSAGPRYQPPLQAGSWAIAPLICYEIAYPDYTARQAQIANMIITISNDTWFGRSLGPHQHLQMARMRARETGRPIIRATNNGVTALVDHDGNIREQLPSFETGVLTGSIEPTKGQTLFSIWASWPLLGLALLLMLAKRHPQTP